MIPITIALIVIQEMAARMGAVTGKGLSDLIREEYGFRTTFFMMLLLVVCNFGNVVAEFGGISTSMELFGLSKYASVPIAAAFVWLIVVKGNKIASVSEGGKPLTGRADLSGARQVSDDVVVEVGSGKYEFESVLPGGKRP